MTASLFLFEYFLSSSFSSIACAGARTHTNVHTHKNVYTHTPSHLSGLLILSFNRGVVFLLFVSFGVIFFLSTMPYRFFSSYLLFVYFDDYSPHG